MAHGWRQLAARRVPRRADGARGRGGRSARSARGRRLVALVRRRPGRVAGAALAAARHAALAISARVRGGGWMSLTWWVTARASSGRASGSPSSFEPGAPSGARRARAALSMRSPTRATRISSACLRCSTGSIATASRVCTCASCPWWAWIRSGASRAARSSAIYCSRARPARAGRVSCPHRPARLTPKCILVVENLETGISLPDLESCVAFMKLGNGVSVLSRLPWAAGVRAVYWGDIDTHGFAILSHARGALPGRSEFPGHTRWRCVRRAVEGSAELAVPEALKRCSRCRVCRGTPPRRGKKKRRWRRAKNEANSRARAV